MIRKNETERVPLESKLVPILVFKGGKLEEAKTLSEKLDLLKRSTNKDLIVAVWPGQWSSDTFIIDRSKALRILKS